MSRMLASQTLSDRRPEHNVSSSVYLNSVTPGGYGKSSDAMQAVVAASKYREEAEVAEEAALEGGSGGGSGGSGGSGSGGSVSLGGRSKLQDDESKMVRNF